MSDNIWKNFSFKENKQKSALDYLYELRTGLIEKTGGELTLETEVVASVYEDPFGEPVFPTCEDGNPPKIAALYKLFVVAPKLGNFRRKILTVAEYSEQGRFPVDLFNHFSDDGKQIDISEKDIMIKVSEILTSPLVKNTIENLYQQSIRGCD